MYLDVLPKPHLLAGGTFLKWLDLEYVILELKVVIVNEFSIVLGVGNENSTLVWAALIRNL